MTNHAIEIVTANSQKSNPSNVPEPGPPDFVASLVQDRIEQNVKGNHSEVLSNQSSDMSETAPVDGGTNHFRGQVRFDSASDKTTLLDDIENGVVADAEWYEIRYHECTHDEANPSACPDWTAERTDGTIPSDV